METVLVHGIADPVYPHSEWLKANIVLTPQRGSYVFVRTSAVAEPGHEIPRQCVKYVIPFHVLGDYSQVSTFDQPLCDIVVHFCQGI